MGERTFWYAPNLSTYSSHKGSRGVLPSFGFIRALINDKEARNAARKAVDEAEANLIASRCADGRHMPVIDLDVPHHLVPSTTPGHGHLYIDVKTSWPRYVVMLFSLRLCGVIEKGHLWWSIRLGATFVRKPGVLKEEAPF